MKKTTLNIRRFITGAAAMALLGGWAHAENLSIGSMPVGSGWYVGAAAYKKAVEASGGPLTLEVIARGGGVANPLVVEQKKADVAISNVATTVWARDGIMLYKGKEAKNVRSIVGGLNPVYIGAIVRNKFMEQNGFKTLKDVLESGKPINILMKPPGSNIPPTVDVVLAAHGTSIQKIKSQGGQVIQVNPDQMASIIRDGRADIYFDTILRGHPTITEIALTGDVKFLDMSEESITALAKVGLKRGNIPKWFDGQTAEVLGADFGTHLIVNKDMPDEQAYQLTKLFVEHSPEIAEEFKAWKAFKPELAATPENNGVPLHPGAIRYYKEKNILK